LQQSRALLEEIQNSRVVAEEAVEAARLYCIILDQEGKQAPDGPT